MKVSKGSDGSLFAVPEGGCHSLDFEGKLLREASVLSCCHVANYHLYE